MEPFHRHTGTTVSIMLDHIDTDQIIPKQYLKRVERSGFGPFLFDEWRYLEDRTLNSDFILNDPSRKDATILITGDNFGCGSSREHAPWAIKDYGFRAIIGGSFADIFYMNCFNNGILPIVLPKEQREHLADLTGDAKVTIDLEGQFVLFDDHIFPFEMDPSKKEKLFWGLDDIALTLRFEAAISQFEEKRKLSSSVL